MTWAPRLGAEQNEMNARRVAHANTSPRSQEFKARSSKRLDILDSTSAERVGTRVAHPSYRTYVASLFANESKTSSGKWRETIGLGMSTTSLIRKSPATPINTYACSRVRPWVPAK
jgi:hypothetical protein